MSASAKPTEKLFKSFLAAVLAISLCPLMPVDKAQAEEAGIRVSKPTQPRWPMKARAKRPTLPKALSLQTAPTLILNWRGRTTALKMKAQPTIAMSPCKRQTIREPQSSTGPNAAPANG